MTRRDFLATAAAAGAAATLAKPVPADTQAKNPMQMILWCWDARMTWDDEPDAISVKMAASEQPFPYMKRPEAYQTGFRRLVDYCAATGIRAVVIWGFLRDSHGGVEAARDLCRYAADRGVGILPGVGLCAYGGYYFEGDHPFNLNTYLRKHPERISRAVEEGGKREVTPVLDPSLEANRQWWRDGLEWMFENFAIAGIDYEMGDFVVNPSPEAVKARADLGFAADGNILETVVATRELMDRAQALKPDGIFINCTYRGLERITGFPAMPYVKAVHEKTVWEYSISSTVRRADFPDAFAGMPPHRMYGYLHWFNSSTKTMEKDYVADIARLYPAAARLGFEFIGTYGEVSPKTHPVADRNYRAQAAWAKDPSLSLDAFQ